MKFTVAEGLSKRTIDSCEFYLNQWMEHVGDQDVAKVTASDLTNYIAWMRTEYKPRRWNGNKELDLRFKKVISSLLTTV